MEYSRKVRYHYYTQSLIHITKYTHTRRLKTDPFFYSSQTA
jgi:hypothetical protein